MLHIFATYLSYVLVMIRYCELPLFSMTVYMVAQKQHRIKKLLTFINYVFNIYIMYTMQDQKSAGDPQFSEAEFCKRFLLK